LNSNPTRHRKRAQPGLNILSYPAFVASNVVQQRHLPIY
jgi:hypothetical protein